MWPDTDTHPCGAASYIRNLYERFLLDFRWLALAFLWAVGYRPEESELAAQ